MTSLFGKKRQDEVEAARHMAIKLTLSKEVASSIKKLQRDHISTDSAIRSGDTANRFCNVMEAILLHELKDSYSSKTFWPFLIKFTHRDVLEQIKELSFIKTEIGFCRAWVRLALNDCLMESYMSAMLRDTKAIRQFYGRNSFFRDQEQPHIIKNYLQGLGNFSFQLSYNSNLLNVWGAAPSMLKGSWSPPGDSQNQGNTSSRTPSVSEYPPDWADNASTSTRSSFTIPDGALRVVPSNSEDTPYEVSSFHESELSTNLLRSLEDDSHDTIEDAIARNSYSDDAREPLPSVVLEESEEFEDSIVIHLSQPEILPSTSERQAVTESAKDSAFAATDIYPMQSSNPFDEDVEFSSNAEQGFGRNDANASKNGANLDPGLASSDAKSKDGSPLPDDGFSYKLDNKWEEGDELNPFFQEEAKDDDVVPSTGQTKERVPSLKDELNAAGVKFYIDNESNGFHNEEENVHGGADVRQEKMDRLKEEEEEEEQEESCITDPWQVKDSAMDQGQNVAEESKDGAKEEEFTNSYGNSLGAFRGWSSEFPTNKQSPVVGEDAPDSYIRQESYQTLLKNYMDTTNRSMAPVSNLSPLTSGSSDDTTDGQSAEPPRQSPIPSSPQASELPLDFEIIPFSSSPASKHADMRTQELLAKVMTIANEKGLDTQNYQCKGCSRPVGIIYGKAKVCGYDGCYYCYECHVDEEAIIPARILYNWDFRKHKVAKHTKSFLQQIEAMPLVDIAEANSSLYKAVPELEEVKNIRMQLKYLKAYLFTCKQSVAEELKKRVWPREYMLDHVHLYSVLDFSQVQAGTLFPILKKVVVFAVKHVQQCALCSQKGFICEICENSKIIYPFDTDFTVQCEKCKAVYHKACKTDLKGCPKCVRRKLRKNQPQQGTSQENFVSPFT